jgi:hypothetical protein
MNRHTWLRKIKIFGIRGLVLVMIAALVIPAVPVLGRRQQSDDLINAQTASMLAVAQQTDSPVCPLTHLSLVSEPGITRSKEGLASTDFQVTWENSARRFEGRAQAFAGELSTFICLLNPLTCLNPYTLFSSVRSLLDDAWGNTQVNSIVLRLEGPEGAQVAVKASGEVDGLLVGVVFGIASVRSKVRGILDLNLPGSVRHLVDVNKEEIRYGAAQYSQHIQGSGSGVGSHSWQLNVGDQINLSGSIRAESDSQSVLLGLSGGYSYFTPVSGVMEVSDPAMLISVEVLNTYPMLSPGYPEVIVAAGQVATMSGTYCDGDGDPLTLTASVGTVSDNGDGTWSWSYQTSSGGFNNPVTITARDTNFGMGTTSFLVKVAEIGIEVRVNGEDADTAPGPQVISGEPVTFEYLVSNVGDVTLSNVIVTDKSWCLLKGK